MSETSEEAILETMKRLGGEEIPLKKIYDGMDTHPLVTPYHGKSWKSGKQSRYECWIKKSLRKNRELYKIAVN